MACFSNVNHSANSRFYSRSFIEDLDFNRRNRFLGEFFEGNYSNDYDNIVGNAFNRSHRDGCCKNQGCDCCCSCCCSCCCCCCCGCSCGCSCGCGCNNQNQTVQLCFTNISTSGSPISGSTFSLTSEGQINNVATTDTSGRACFTLEHFKNYQLRQTSVPLGYILNTTVYNIFVDCSGNIFVNGALNTNLVITNDILV